MVLSDTDLYRSDSNLNFLIGEGPKQGTILSIARYKNEPKEVIKEAALHEFGYTFAGYGHCENECTMKFPNAIPNDLRERARYRTRSRITYCGNHPHSRSYEPQVTKAYKAAFPEIQIIEQGLKQRDPRLKRIIDSGTLAKFTTHATIK